MRPISKGDAPVGAVYTEYGQARPELITRLGDYCSYCENQITNPHTEHEQPKGVTPGIELNWYNFLLACTSCNSRKGHDWINMDDYYWPDMHNTHLLFEYYPYGIVTVKSNLAADIDRDRADRTFDLTGLSAYAHNTTESDRRWVKRSEAWGKAEDCLMFYSNYNYPLDYIRTITNMATATGYWSVWMKAFDGHPDVQDALIIAFNGTFALCRTTNINRV